MKKELNTLIDDNELNKVSGGRYQPKTLIEFDSDTYHCQVCKQPMCDIKT